MDLDRIERALREGPADEPIYEPRAFGRRRGHQWLLFAGGMAGAMILGVVVGLGIGVVRQPVGDDGVPAVDLDRLGEELSGSWMSTSFTEQEFVGHLTEAGYSAQDIAAFLEHDPIPGTVRWGLDFDGRERLVVFRTLDEAQTEILTNVVYELLPDGRLRLIEGGCSVVIGFLLEGELLTFAQPQFGACVPDTDTQVAFETFFGLAPPYQQRSTAVPSSSASTAASASPSPEATTEASPHGVYVNEAMGWSIVVPPGWEVTTNSTGDTAVTRDQVIAEILVSPASGMTLEQLAAQRMADLRTWPGMDAVEGEIVRLPVGDAVRTTLEMTHPDGEQAVFVSYAIEQGGRQYVISVRGPQDDGDLLVDAEAFASSFALTD